MLFHDKEITPSQYHALTFQLGDLTITCSISSPLACVDYRTVVSNTFSEARSCHIRSRRSFLRCNPYTWLSGMIAESLGGHLSLPGRARSQVTTWILQQVVRALFKVDEVMVFHCPLVLLREVITGNKNHMYERNPSKLSLDLYAPPSRCRS